MNTHLPFGTADILIPKHPTHAWPVVACDQYTSEPEYWDAVKRLTEGKPSTYHLTLPEIYLKETTVSARIDAINAEMTKCLTDGTLATYRDTMILVERTLADGRVRRGIVGAIDLNDYDYAPGTKPLIRATEGTVLERIPPRVAIRKDAPMELPHVMLLIDDPDMTVIEPLSTENQTMLYDIDLMQNGGHLRGYALFQDAVRQIRGALAALMQGEDPMLFAVGDGNHSLATAKACAALDPTNPLAGKALVEIVNIHSPALDFEPIYRVLFDVNAEDVLAAAKAYFAAETGEKITLLLGDREEAFFATGLISAAVQDFIDTYLAAHPSSSVDYIHGEAVVKKLAKQSNTVGFIFPGIAKSALFPYVKAHGALPRKTFSMGEANDKRFYMEGRRIK